MNIKIDSTEYELLVGSDIIRDGMYIEASILNTNPLLQIAEIFFSDITHKFTVTTFVDNIPMELIEKMIIISKERLLPVGFTIGNLSLRIENINKEPNTIELLKEYQFLINIECNFRIYDGDFLFLDIPHFCIIEFIKNLSDWFFNSSSDDFQYLTMDDDETEIFRLTYIDDSYIIKSCWQKAPIKNTLTKEEIKEIIKNLLDIVDDQIKVKFGIDLKD